jgi:hypothetical protein
MAPVVVYRFEFNGDPTPGTSAALIAAAVRDPAYVDSDILKEES